MIASAFAALVLIAAANVPESQSLSTSPPPAAAEGAEVGATDAGIATESATPESEPAAEVAEAEPAPEAADEAKAATDAPAPEPVPTGKTLWLVQPLYPGQELLVSRTEVMINQLLPKEERDQEVVGRGELAKNIEGSKATLDCIFGSVKCADPIGALVSSIGVQRVVLIKVGQEGSGYRFRVASFQPGNTALATAESEDANMERALLGAIVRVAPLAAMVEVLSDPPGATVFVDGEKVGVTPLNAQVLPGERKIRLELAFHKAWETTQIVPVRGQVQVQESLGQLPGRLRVVSAGATILVDGEEVGTDEVEIGATAGTHAVRLVRDGYEPHEIEVEVKPEGVTELKHTLEPTFWESVGQSFSDAHKEIYEQGGFVAFVYDQGTLSSDRFVAHGLRSTIDRLPSEAKVQSFGVELGSWWRNFGMMWFSGSYFRSPEPWTFELDNDDADTFDGTMDGGTLRLLQPQLRLPIWRFIVGVRGGLLGRGGVASGSGGGQSYVFYDAGAEARGTLQFHIYGGLYIEGGYGRTWSLTDNLGGSEEIRGGIGYAY